MNFGLRFDFRNPKIAGTSMADRYAAALEMAEWGDRLGCTNISISEHHGSLDGYLPSPIPMVAAMAARTKVTRLTIAALIAPFHDPLRLAEDLVVLDNLSKGRINIIVAAGYVQEEFEMFDVPLHERARRVIEAVVTLKAAFRGDPFTYRGRTVRVTPAPHRRGGPTISLGGSSEAAARRAARIADGFVPSLPELWTFYRDEVQRLGRPDPGPGPTGGGRVGADVVTALAEDPDGAWSRFGPFFLHETNAYAAWNTQARIRSPYQMFESVDHLRQSGRYRIVTPEEFVVEQKALATPYAHFHPLCGGIPMDLAWSSLHLFEHQVIPQMERA